MPDFFPAVPPLASLGGVAGDADHPAGQRAICARRTIMQSAMAVERQLPRNTTLAITYANSHGLHMLRSEDINAPLPGTGIFPARDEESRSS